MKQLCPAHQDSTPSLEVYPDGAYCFVCGYSCSLDQINVDPAKVYREPTDVPAEIARIQGLPRTEIRGLQLPYDDTGYYIVWPDNSFYKKRWFRGDTRYTGPRGVRPPMFLYPGEHKKQVVVVEGEINAMSLKLAYPNTKTCIVSPGSITNTVKPELHNYCLEFDSTYAIVDYDAAGVVYGKEFKYQLLQKGKRVDLIPLKQDFNDILITRGILGIKEIIEKENLAL